MFYYGFQIGKFKFESTLKSSCSQKTACLEGLFCFCLNNFSAKKMSLKKEISRLIKYEFTDLKTFL